VPGLAVLAGRPTPSVPVPGQVVARNAAGERFTSTRGKDGRFRLSLPPGTYWLSGHSPEAWLNGQEVLCTAMQTLQVTKNRPTPTIKVVCAI